MKKGSKRLFFLIIPAAVSYGEAISEAYAMAEKRILKLTKYG